MAKKVYEWNCVGESGRLWRWGVVVATFTPLLSTFFPTFCSFLTCFLPNIALFSHFKVFLQKIAQNSCNLGAKYYIIYIENEKREDFH